MIDQNKHFYCYYNRKRLSLFILKNTFVMPDQKPNRLIHESSPYLIQHAYNPVDWYPYGEEALELARTTNRPLLISIGYSACHWCHVMEHESFSNAEVAEIMNREFVCVKVDREERPDVDQVFMAAVQLLHNSGGWPLNCFALPDGRPFWGGTYFRPEQWIELLGQVSELFKRSFSEVEQQADRLAEGTSAMSIIEAPADASRPDMEFVNELYDQLSLRFDTETGGTVGAPKFPMPVVWEFVSAYYQVRKFPEAFQQLSLTLQKMAMGGIFDQIGGGFARYSTDTLWKVPHFEKMLYDNAQLVSLYAKTYALSGDVLLRETLDKTLAFIEKEFAAEEGYFYSALDADSEGEEGLFYLWTREEIKILLPEYGDLVSDYFGVDNQGLWEDGKSILVRPLTDDTFASRQHLSAEELRQLIKMSSAVMLKARDERIKPGLDNKMILSWNAMMVEGLIDSFHAIGNPWSKKAALKAGNYIASVMMEADGSLLRTLAKDKEGIPGFLDDYAFTIRAFIALYQLDFDEVWLQRARQLCNQVMGAFADEASPLFYYVPQNIALRSSQVRIKEVTDGVEPSANAVMAEVLTLLGHYFEEDNWLDYASRMLLAMKSRMLAYPSAHAHWAKVALMHVTGVTTIIITGPLAFNFAEALRPKAGPFTLMAATIKKESLPVFKKRIKPEETLIYVCEGNVCQTAVTSPEDVNF